MRMTSARKKLLAQAAPLLEQMGVVLPHALKALDIGKEIKLSRQHVKIAERKLKKYKNALFTIGRDGTIHVQTIGRYISVNKSLVKARQAKKEQQVVVA